MSSTPSLMFFSRSVIAFFFLVSLILSKASKYIERLDTWKLDVETDWWKPYIYTCE